MNIDPKSRSEIIAKPILHVETKSVPTAITQASSYKLKVHISAPSYLNYFKENEAPPFRKPIKESKPKLLIGTIMTTEDAIEMIGASGEDGEGLQKFIEHFLIEKKIIANFNLSEKFFLTSLILEVISYAEQRDFSAFKLACMVTLYLNTHMYFKWYYWSTPTTVWNYFKEIMIRHAIQDSPDGQEVFEAKECCDILSHFHTIYMNNLPLVHIVSFGVCRLKFLWPFKKK